MRPLISLLIILIGLTSCQWDNFHDVSKIIEAPGEIELNQSFTFKLKLLNETDTLLPLTLDKEIIKSLDFMPWWYCGGTSLKRKTLNPKNQHQDFYSVELKPGDSLTFELTAQMKLFSNKDSLRFIIDGYERDFVMANPKCDDFYMDFEGMWLPGDGPIGDSMEGYGFSTKIKIINSNQQQNKVSSKLQLKQKAIFAYIQ